MSKCWRLRSATSHAAQHQGRVARALQELRGELCGIDMQFLEEKTHSEHLAQLGCCATHLRRYKLQRLTSEEAPPKRLKKRIFARVRE